MFPVDDRSAETLIPIIEKYVKPGTRILSDGWAAYEKLNLHGYEHFSVCHKTAFEATYKHIKTGETVEVNTNRIEGAWAHAKNHFKKIYGTSSGNFV